MPFRFASMAGYGDLTSAILAIVAMLGLRARLDADLALVWIFNIVGTLDLLNALLRAEAVPYFGATWFIPTFLVPLLLVSHAMIFIRLLRTKSTASNAT